MSPTTAAINLSGVFLNAAANADGAVTVSMPDASGEKADFTFASMSAFRGFVLLHESGHQMGRYGPDLSPAENGANSGGVLEHCFDQNAQGVYY